MLPKNAERKKHNRQDRLPSEVTRKYDSPMDTQPGETAQSRTVAKLKHRLRSGQFINAMPGERELSKALAAGRGTIRKALAQLQEEGFIAAPVKTGPGKSSGLLQALCSLCPCWKTRLLPLLRSYPGHPPKHLGGTLPTGKSVANRRYGASAG